MSENMKPTVKRQRYKKQPIIVNDFSFVAPDRNRKDVGSLKQAVERAESVHCPNRYRLYDLYHDLLTLDAHLSGICDKRVKTITNKVLFFADRNGTKVDAMDDLISSPRFERLLEIIMETLLWGTSAVEFLQGDSFDFVEIDRRHIRPENRQIAKSQFDYQGLDIDGYPNLWLLGRPDDLGLLLRCSMYALYKRSGVGDFAQYVEIFGQPVRIIKYDAYDLETQKKLKSILDQSGSSLVMMLPKQTDFEMLDGKTSNGNGELQQRLVNLCNQEMSVAILGCTETTVSSSSSGYAQASVHADQQEELARADTRYVISLLNSPFFLRILASYGLPVEGGSFQCNEKRSIAELKEQLDIDLRVADKVPVSDDYWYETYGIPKPDNYDQLKKEQDERRQAALDALRRSAGQTGDADEGQGDGEKGKKSDKKDLADRLLGFFGLAPL